MKIVVPMAGRGSRFLNAGETTPKPLIAVRGKPMLYWAMKSVEGVDYSQLIFIALREHDERYGVTTMLKTLYGKNAEIILLDEVTEGQLCTVLSAEDALDSPEDVLVMSADTFVKSKIGKHIAERRDDCAGIISVANLPGDRWSFAKVDETGRVVEVAEKQRISDYASTGLYYFSDGKEFVKEAKTMIANKEKTCGEYYVIPVYQKLIAKGRRVEISLADKVYDMGTPEALKQVLNVLP
ncbi:MAG: glycosyltransferase family 2 protein [Chloroherpetonaceae bacterium]|nr:glycosyltransferase family 2 protein [Chloroherpetonaceae bacterium]